MQRRKKYEIALFNSAVRELLAEGLHHKQLRDDWADIHYIEVYADNETMARAQITGRYPERAGYVIDSVRELRA